MIYTDADVDELMPPVHVYSPLSPDPSRELNTTVDWYSRGLTLTSPSPTVTRLLDVRAEPALVQRADTVQGMDCSSSGMCMEQVRLSWRPVKKSESTGEPVMVTAGGGTAEL